MIKFIRRLFNSSKQQCNIPVVSGSCLKKADMWYCTHKNHVNKLYWQAHIGYAPTEPLDINNPELWKPEHWKWYLDNYR